MRRLLPLLLFPLAGCPTSPSGGNPSSLWLGFMNTEGNIVLIDHEPPPF
jgi:hypothetical protein